VPLHGEWEVEEVFPAGTEEPETGGEALWIKVGGPFEAKAVILRRA
jgi:hypothetical protein